MFNILVADSMEYELNHIILLLEDYKANNPEFDKILNVIDTESREEAIEIIKREKIDILFISLDMDRVAFEAYKNNKKTLIVSITEDKHRLRKWYADSLNRPISQNVFNLRLRSYLDILVNRKIGIKEYEKRTIYDLSLVSNLQLFWEDYFTTRLSVNKVIHTIYGIGLVQIDRGISSTIDVVERDDSITFKLSTEMNSEVLTYLDTIKDDIEFRKYEDSVEFDINLNTDKTREFEEAGEFEDFALEYLSYDRFEILNDFLIQNEIAENEESIKELEKKLYTSNEVQIEEIEAYIHRKKNLGKRRYIFLDNTDLKIFGDIIDSLESLLINNSGEKISIDEVGTVVDAISNIAQILTIYPPAKQIVNLLNKFETTLLSNGKKVEELGKNGVEKIGQIIELLSNWRHSLLKRENPEEDLIDDKFIDALKDILNSLEH